MGPWNQNRDVTSALHVTASNTRQGTAVCAQLRITNGD